MGTELFIVLPFIVHLISSDMSVLLGSLFSGPLAKECRLLLDVYLSTSVGIFEFLASSDPSVGYTRPKKPKKELIIISFLEPRVH